jgi:phenylpropionate dioxygenase-like ring-hydroxylating dioxygenase large terminal subunit
MNRPYRQLQAEETALLRGVGSGSEMLLKELEHAKANVQEGGGLGSRFYSSPEILNLEREAVFLKAWQFAVHENQVEQPNSYALARLGEFEVVVTRDGSEEIRAFQNMCLHRGSRLVDCDGQAKTLV